jgi:hypothetical protein
MYVGTRTGCGEISGNSACASSLDDDAGDDDDDYNDNNNHRNNNNDNNYNNKKNNEASLLANGSRFVSLFLMRVPTRAGRRAPRWKRRAFRESWQSSRSIISAPDNLPSHSDQNIQKGKKGEIRRTTRTTTTATQAVTIYESRKRITMQSSPPSTHHPSSNISPFQSQEADSRQF